jgi:hypothetical protein
VSALDFKDPLQFWEILSAVMNENPPSADQIAALLPMFKPLGLELGKQWDRSKVDPIVLNAMASAAKEIPDLMNTIPFGRLENGWFIPPPTIGDPRTDYTIRSIVARVGLTANAPREAVYLDGMLDADGNRLTGAKRYNMTFKQTPPFHESSFWALRMFETIGSYFESNDESRPRTSIAITDSLISSKCRSIACSTTKRRQRLARSASPRVALASIRSSCARTRSASMAEASHHSPKITAYGVVHLPKSR